MRWRARFLAVVLLLAIAGPVQAEPPTAPVVSQREMELYSAGIRQEAAKDECRIMLNGTLAKLATRTPTATMALIGPSAGHERETDWKWLAVAGGAGVIFGVVLGVVAAGRTGTTIVK